MRLRGAVRAHDSNKTSHCTTPTILVLLAKIFFSTEVGFSTYITFAHSDNHTYTDARPLTYPYIHSFTPTPLTYSTDRESSLAANHELVVNVLEAHISRYTLYRFATFSVDSSAWVHGLTK